MGVGMEGGGENRTLWGHLAEWQKSLFSFEADQVPVTILTKGNIISPNLDYKISTPPFM